MASAAQPSWYHTYAQFQAEVASHHSSFVPFVAALPPVHMIENFTYENGKFTLYHS